MNTGIQDAYNLAWKLALVIQQKSPESLLDSYELERRPIAEKVLRETTLMTQIVTLKSPWLIKLRTPLFKLLNKIPRIKHKLIDGLAEIGDGYAKSNIITLNGYHHPGNKYRLPSILIADPQEKTTSSESHALQNIYFLSLLCVIIY